MGEGIKIYLYITTSLLIILSFATLILLIYSLIKDNTSNKRRGQKQKKIRKRQYPSIYCAFFEFCSCCVFIGVIYELRPRHNNNFSSNTNFLISAIICGVFIFLSKLSLYAHFLVAIYNTFKGSALSMNRSTIISCIILFILSIICLIWWIILISVRNVGHKLDDQIYSIQLIVILLLLILINGALCYMIVFLFTRKLFRFLLFRDRSMFLQQAEKRLGFQVSDIEAQKSLVADVSDEDHLPSDNIHNKDDDRTPDNKSIGKIRKTYSFVLDIVGAGIDDKDMKTLDLITKQFLLSSLSIIITTFVYLTLMFTVIFRHSLEEHFLWIYWLFGGIYYPLDVVINCLVLYFNYGFAAESYMKCCKFCHERSKNCAIRRAAKKIYKQHYDELMLKK